MHTAPPVAIGMALGDCTAMTLSMLGLAALLAASSLLFTLPKWAGAAYLVWLGIELWRAGGTRKAAPSRDQARAQRMLGHAWLLTALNPKSLTFFVAFLLQFIDRNANFWTQMLLFESTLGALAFANAAGYGLVASPAHRRIASARQQGFGPVLIGAGIAAAGMRGSH